MSFYKRLKLSFKSCACKTTCAYARKIQILHGQKFEANERFYFSSFDEQELRKIIEFSTKFSEPTLVFNFENFFKKIDFFNRGLWCF